MTPRRKGMTADKLLRAGLDGAIPVVTPELHGFAERLAQAGVKSTEGQRRAGKKRADEKRATMKIRRVLVEWMFYGCDGCDDGLRLPKELADHPTGENTLAAIRKRLEKLDRMRPRNLSKFTVRDTTLKAEIRAVRHKRNLVS